MRLLKLLFSFSVSALIAFVMSGCSNGKLNLSSLGFQSTQFAVSQNGKATNVLKLNLLTQSASFTAQFPKQTSSIQISFDQGTTWEPLSQISDLSSSTSDLTFDPSALTTLANPTAAMIPAKLRAKGAAENTTDLDLTFVRASFTTANFMIEHGSLKTRNLTVSLQGTALETVGTYSWPATQIYASPTPACGAGGSWVPYQASFNGIPLALANSTNVLYVKFRDDVGNESPCLTQSIIQDSTPPTAISFSINSGATQTATANVSLAMSAGVGPFEMSLNGTTNCSGTASWVPYATSMALTLPAPGVNNLSVKFRDDVGNESACLAASILYDSAPVTAPTSLTLATGVTSPSNQNPISIVVSPAASGTTAKLYSDPACSTLVGSALGSGTATVSTTLIGSGTKNFYATITNGLGVTSPCSTASVAYLYDTTGPTITNISSDTANGELVTGASVNFNVTFSDPVTVTGLPKLSLGFASGATLVNYSSTVSGTILRFTYVITAANYSSKLDLTSTSALTVSGASIRDAAGNDATLTVPIGASTGSLASNRNFPVNLTPTALSLMSGFNTVDHQNPVSILVPNVFDGNVATLYTDATCTTTAASATASGGQAIVSVTYGSNTTKTFWAKVRDPNTNVSSPCSTASVTYTYDSVVPTITGVTSTLANSDYATGTDLPIKVTFSEPVIVSNGAPTLSLAFDGGNETATYVSGSGTATLNFTYKVLAGDSTSRLDLSSTSGFQLNGSRLRDAAGNDATVTAPIGATVGALAANKLLQINFKATSLTLSGAQATDNKNPFTIVVGSVSTGNLVQIYSDNNCSNTLRGSATAAAGVATVSVTPPSQGLTNYYARVSDPNNGMQSLCSTVTVAYTYDSAAPVVTSVTSTPLTADYVSGQTFQLKVLFSKSISVVTTGGSPTLSLLFNSGSGVATFASASGNTLTFNYLVKDGDVDDDIDVASTTALKLNGATIRDSSSNDAVLTLPVASNASSLLSLTALRLNYAAKVSSLAFSPDNDFFVGDRLDFVIKWKSPVTVSTTGGTPSLTVKAVGTGTTFDVPFDSYRSGGTETVFMISPLVASVSAIDAPSGLTVMGINLNGGTIKNVFSADADLTLPTNSAPGVIVHAYATPLVSVSTAETVVSESAGSTSFTVSLDTAAPTDVYVSYRVLANSTATASDHGLVSGTTRIDAGQTSKTVSFGLTKSPTNTGTRGLTVALISASPGRIKAASASKRFVITDADVTDLIAELATGTSHSCARYVSGKVMCWGDNTYGQLGGTPVNGYSTVTLASATRIVAAGNSTCGIGAGHAYCWGANSTGVLGNNSLVSKSTPTEVGDGTHIFSNVTDISLSERHACFVNSGGVYCWGANDSYQLGSTAVGPVKLPQSISSLGTSVTKVTTGDAHSCALVSGTLKCWGSNDYYQIGTNSTSAPVATPTTVNNNLGVTISEIAAGRDSTCALSTAGKVYCWGVAYDSGGTAPKTRAIGTPNFPYYDDDYAVDGVTHLYRGFTVGAGTSGYCATDGAARTLCWGTQNANTGMFFTADGSIVPTAIPTATYSSPVSISMSGSTLCLSNGKTVFCSGGNGSANAYNIADYPFLDRLNYHDMIKLNVSVTDLASSSSGGCVILSDGSVECALIVAGDGTGGTGDPTRTTPVRTFKSGVTKVTVASGSNLGCAVRSDKTLWCWGNGAIPGTGNYLDQNRALPSYVMSDVIDVKLEKYSVCALTSTHNIYCWGSNTSGAAGIGAYTALYRPTLVPGVDGTATSISAGDGHHCYTSTDGSFYCVGYNNYGQLGDTTQTDRTSYVPVYSYSASATPLTSIGGVGSTCGIYGNGDVSCWGLGTEGQLGRGSLLTFPLPVSTIMTGATSLASGGRSSCATKADGTLYCWGGHALVGQTPGTYQTAPTLITSNVTSLWGAAANLVSYGNGSVDPIILGPAATYVVRKTDGYQYVWGSSNYVLLPRRAINDYSGDYLMGL